ncbi:GH25 family lysozyme [Ligilactobacillus saerimneri]|uniref:GH25 family lysozyme n=1 Tax=Ligilactobacillus saerimneri TaxID=228229 RepID=UPI0004243887|nr:GH25 family lysozyme [Ligilactobacillus saerimneri]
MTMYGVDVYSGSDDRIIRDSHAQVVIVKATQGTTYVNPKANHQYELAKSLGKLVGTYHYAGGGDPVAEAQFFIKNIKNWVGEAVLVLDWEKYQNGAFGDSSWSRRFVDEVHRLTGVWPLVYVSESVIPQVANCAKDCGLWVAKYASMTWHSWTVPDMPVKTAPWGTYTMWQFTGDDMDRNIINTDAEGWKRLAKGSGKVTPAPEPNPQPRPQAKNTWVDDLGVTWYKETGSFTITDPMGIWLRWGATVKSTKIAALPRGSVVKYDAYCYSGGYVWIRQPRGNGQYGYLPTGEAKGSKRLNYWGVFK